MKNRNLKKIQPEYTDIVSEIEQQLRQWSVERNYEMEQMKRLETYRKEFLGNVSHELKTPVFNIQGYVLTLLDGGMTDPTINKDYLVRTEKSVDRMISIIDDLEAISQLETGELELEPDQFDITALTNEVFEEQELKATGKGIILSFEDTEQKPVFVWADKFRIKQVMTNLIVNSINYGKEYGETTVSFYESGNKITLEVADNGIGIAQEQLPRLFERFYRVDKSRSREGGGTGLGLSIVKHIIEAHNQTIQVESRPGEGTIFSFNLLKSR
jgi:two-component system, OmpR family, phosphate regulon sensor histidine kinase PhoR